MFAMNLVQLASTQARVYISGAKKKVLLSNRCFVNDSKVHLIGSRLNVFVAYFSIIPT